VLGALAWMAGTALQLQQAATWPAARAGLLGLGATALLGVVSWRALAHRARTRDRPDPARAGQVRSLAVCLAAVLALAAMAFALTDLRATQRLHAALPAELEGQDLQLLGTVAGLPRTSPQGTYFDFEPEAASLRGQPVAVPARLSLGWFTGWDGETLLAAPGQALIAGDRWRLTVRLKRPHGVLNPEGFDLELWLFERGVGATGTVRPGSQWLGTGWSRPLDRLRQRARDAILMRVADPAAAGVLAALAVGDQSAIHRDDWELFRLTGVAHLMSISGLHVTVFAWLAAALIGRLWRRWPAALLRLPVPVAARWGGLLVATTYALLAGWGVPAQRTVLMLAVVALARALGWRWPWPLIWLSAGLAVTLLDPWALLQPGFWLSFVAVGLLMASEPALATRDPARGWRAMLLAGLRTQAVASVGLAPLSLVFFQQVSIVGALANLLAIPWVTLVVMPLALLGLLLPPLWQLGAWSVQGLVAVLAPLAAWPLAVWSAAATGTAVLLLGLAAGALLVLPLPWRLRLLGLPMLLPLLLPDTPRPAQGELQILVADIGQGTAVLVRTRHHLLLYDTGPRTSSESDAGSRVLLPLLRAQGDSRIDRLVLSHRDTDHTGGAESVLRGLPVLGSLSSLEPDHPLRDRLPGHQRCAAGQAWTWDGVHFQVLHPREEDYGRDLPPNGLSCVIRVSDARGPRLMLSGDIEAAQEAELLARSPQGALAAPLLLLPHHGSRTSSTPEWLAEVAPRQAIVQVAYRNRFGHPAPVVQERLARMGIPVVRTDRCGAWQWPAGSYPTQGQGQGVYTAGVAADPGICERDRRRRYWHHPGAS
jgi:competence protein ComEC